MSLLEWIILGGIVAICIFAVRVVADLKKQGVRYPGSMCGGCPDYCQFESEAQDEDGGNSNHNLG